jgi:hypothetical protein
MKYVKLPNYSFSSSDKENTIYEILSSNNSTPSIDLFAKKLSMLQKNWYKMKNCKMQSNPVKFYDV